MLAAATLAACSSSGGSVAASSEPRAGLPDINTRGFDAAGAAAPSNAATPASGATAFDAGIASLPPETEVSLDLRLPQASEHYVYALNPNAGNVSIIDATTQAIQTIKTGNLPTYLRTLDGSDDAIVLNIGSDKASVIRVDAASGKASKSDLAVVAGANAIGVAPDSKHAVVYYDSNQAGSSQTSGSYQDVTVLHLSDDGMSDRAISMTVGFRPRDVFFSDDNARAFVVTEDGISVLDFAQIEKQGEGIAKLITFGSIDQKNLDVAVTPDGRFGLARAEGQSMLHLVDLMTGQVRSLPLEQAYQPPPAAPSEDDAGAPAALPLEVTDLDLMPGGKAALAVLRNQHAVLNIPLPDAFDDPSKVTTIQVEGEIIGSVTVAPDGKSALAYTTAANIERITILDLAHGSAPRTLALRKAVRAVAFTPDSQTALITHTKLPGSPSQPGLSPDDVIDRSYGYSLLRVATGDVKLQVTKTDLGPIAMVPDGSFLFILFRDDSAGIKEVQRVSLESFLVDPIIALENPPISIGTAPASGTVFVNLDHPDGRMTFIDWNDPLGKIKTVTGFELNSRIRD